jgi:hypothetical protein
MYAYGYMATFNFQREPASKSFDVYVGGGCGR